MLQLFFSLAIRRYLGLATEEKRILLAKLTTRLSCLDYLVFFYDSFTFLTSNRAYGGPAFAAGFYSAGSKLLELNCAHFMH